MLLKDASLSLCSSATPRPLSNRHYSVSTRVQFLSNPPSNFFSAIVVEFHIQQLYKLVIEPIQGFRVTTENDFIVSPELSLQFKIPLSLLRPSLSELLVEYISEKLSSMPVDPAVIEYLKPHIHLRSVAAAQVSGLQKEFKIVFAVKVTKIDLVDKKECDRFGGHG